MTSPTSHPSPPTPAAVAPIHPDKLPPGWLLTLLLAGMSALGPFAIDAYLPAFAGIAKSVNASPAQMQQTLSAYLFAFAFMNLFHGALSDALGRKPVILAGIAMFGVASVGCAMAQSIETLILFRVLQGLANGAGMVVSRAVIRDLFAPAQAQKVMSQVTIVFGLAPAIAPMVGGLLYEHADWHSIFWMLAGLSLALAASLMLWLPETLPVAARQPLAVMPMMRGYRQLLLSPRFLLLCVTSSVPFNGMFLYVLCAPSFLGDILGLPPSQYFWFFIVTISGIMGGAFASGRLAGKIPPRRQIRHGLLIMLISALANLAANLLFEPHVAWSMWPVMVFAFGWSLMTPSVSLLVLDLVPDRRGMASSLQAVIGSTSNGLVAAIVSPLVMHSTIALASASLALLLSGVLSWLLLRRHYPDTPGVSRQQAPVGLNE